MKIYSVGNEYYDRNWLVKACSIEEAQGKVLKVISDTWGESEAKEAEGLFSAREIFTGYDVVESRDV
jgi:hypothetical protein